MAVPTYTPTPNFGVDTSQVRLQVVKDPHNAMAASDKFDNIFNTMSGAMSMAAPIAGGFMGSGKGAAAVQTALSAVQGPNGMGTPGYYMGSGMGGNPSYLTKQGLNGLSFGNAPGYGGSGGAGGVGGMGGGGAGGSSLMGGADPLADMYSSNMAMIEFQTAASNMSNQFQLLSNSKKLIGETMANAIRNVKA